MSGLLDDARRLERNPFVPLAGPSAAFVCWYCRLESYDAAHTPDCPVRSMPGIVAVLEAAERIETTTCTRCGRPVPRPHPMCLRFYAAVQRPYRCWDCEDVAPWGLMHGACLDEDEGVCLNGHEGAFCTADPPSWRPA